MTFLIDMQIFVRMTFLTSLLAGLIGCAAPPQSISTGITTSLPISWQAPLTNTKGESISNLAGYKIYYGTSSTDYTNEVDIQSPGIVDYVIPDLSSQDYYIVVTAYTVDGVESNYSEELIVSIDSEGTASLL